jgi:hypothetical protein
MKSEEIYSQKSLSIQKSKLPAVGLEQLLLGTTWGSKGFRYTQLHSVERIHQLHHPYHFTLQWGNRLLGNITLDHRKSKIGTNEVNAHYIRYFAFRGGMQAVEGKSNANPRQNELRKRLLNAMQNSPQSEQVNYNENTSLPGITYGFIDGSNARSLNQGNQFQFESIRQFKPLVFFRGKPKSYPDIRSITPNEKPLVKGLIKDHYKDHQLTHWNYLFYNNSYFVVAHKGVIYAGCQVHQNKWKVHGLGSKRTEPLIKPILQNKFVKQYFNPNDFRFLSFDHLFVKPGYEDALFMLFEGLLYRYNQHFGMIALDTNEPMYHALHQPKKLGLAGRFLKFKPGYVMAKGLDGYTLPSILNEKPVFISAFDIT